MKYYDKIDKYENGELSPTERADFERELPLNDEFYNEFISYHKNKLAIRNVAKENLKEIAKDALHTHKLKNNRHILLYRRIAVAAGLLLVVAAGLWWSGGFSNGETPDQLIAAYFEMPAAPSFRNGIDENNENWKKAIDFYRSNDFNAAIPIFNELLIKENFEDKETAKLLLGASLLEVHKLNEAIAIFDEISTASYLKEDAEWYKAIALMKAEKKSEAKIIFEKIASQKNHFKKTEAIEILKVW